MMKKGKIFFRYLFTNFASEKSLYSMCSMPVCRIEIEKKNNSAVLKNHLNLKGKKDAIIKVSWFMFKFMQNKYIF